MARAGRVHQSRACADLRREARFSRRLAPARRRRSAGATADDPVRRHTFVAAGHLRDYAAVQRHRHAGTESAAGQRRRRRARCVAHRTAAAGPARRPAPRRCEYDSDGSRPAVQLVSHVAGNLAGRGVRHHGRAACGRRSRVDGGTGCGASTSRNGIPGSGDAITCLRRRRSAHAAHDRDRPGTWRRRHRREGAWRRQSRRNWPWPSHGA